MKSSFLKRSIPDYSGPARTKDNCATGLGACMIKRCDDDEWIVETTINCLKRKDY